MSYSREILVHGLLERKLGHASATGICEFLPRPHFASWLNTRWNSRVTGLPSSDEVLHVVERKYLANKRANIRKARKLATAVMEIGYHAPTMPSSETTVIADNIGIVRLLCQGPWNKVRTAGERRLQRYRLSFQMQLCYRMLIDGVSSSQLPGAHLRQHGALHDFYCLEAIFLWATEVLRWAGVMTAEFDDAVSSCGAFPPHYFDETMYFESEVQRWGAGNVEEYYMRRFEFWVQTP